MSPHRTVKPSGAEIPPDKRCATCAREFSWRKKWAKNWAEVRYCSAACRRGTPRVGHQLEDEILKMLDARAPTSSVCPSDIARAVGGSTWRDLMPRVREAAARLVGAGKLRVTQGDKSVDPLEAHGPIRLRKP